MEQDFLLVLVIGIGLNHENNNIMDTLTDINAGITGLELRTAINGNNTILNEESEYRNGLMPLLGKRLVTIGDSITSQATWQPTICALKGCTHVKNMGVGGSRIIPVVKDETGKHSGESIYIRADDVDLYTPDIIILMGGQNDGVVTYNETYDLSDNAYTGDELPDGDEDMPSFVAAYKGTLLKLVSQNPTARVYACGVLYNYTTPLTYTQLTYYKNARDAMKAMCDMYAVTFIDTMVGSNMSPWNNDTYNPAVHPTAAGGIRLGQYIASKLI